MCIAIMMICVIALICSLVFGVYWDDNTSTIWILTLVLGLVMHVTSLNNMVNKTKEVIYYKPIKVIKCEENNSTIIVYNRYHTSKKYDVATRIYNNSDQASIFFAGNVSNIVIQLTTGYNEYHKKRVYDHGAVYLIHPTNIVQSTTIQAWGFKERTRK